MRCKAAPLTVEGVLAWADAHHQRHGRWPIATSGPVEGTAETWERVDTALKKGFRGLPRHGTLAQFLAKHRQVRNQKASPLTVAMIEKWAMRHYRRTGKWPDTQSGPVLGVPGESWSKIRQSLRRGLRGLPGGMSLGDVVGPLKEA